MSYQALRTSLHKVLLLQVLEVVSPAVDGVLFWCTYHECYLKTLGVAAGTFFSQGSAQSVSDIAPSEARCPIRASTEDLRRTR